MASIIWSLDRGRAAGRRDMNHRKRSVICHRSVAIDPSISLKVPPSESRGELVGMLKYLSKFVLEILPSVVATIIGAYIVNHYIAPKSAVDAPVAASVS